MRIKQMLTVSATTLVQVIDDKNAIVIDVVRESAPGIPLAKALTAETKEALWSAICEEATNAVIGTKWAPTILLTLANGSVVTRRLPKPEIKEDNSNPFM